MAPTGVDQLKRYGSGRLGNMKSTPVAVPQLSYAHKTKERATEYGTSNIFDLQWNWAMEQHATILCN